MGNKMRSFVYMLVMFVIVTIAPNLAHAIQFGAGTGTSYPTSLDTTFALTNKSGGACTQSADSKKICAELHNDMQSAVVAIQTSLGTGSFNSTARTISASWTFSNTAPSLTLTDTTASAKSLTIVVDANLAQLRESAGAADSLLVLDLANNWVGIGVAPAPYPLRVLGSIYAQSGSFITPDGMTWANNGNYGVFFDASGNVLLNKTVGSVSIGTASPDRLFHPELADAVTAAVSYVQRISHITSGTAAVGFGAGLEWELENASGTNKVVSTIETVFTDATDTSEDADFVVKLMAAGAAAAEKFRVDSTGIATLTSTAPSFVFTDTTASAKSLTIAVDANLAQLRESAGASGSLVVLDLANARVGIGTTAPGYLLSLGAVSKGFSEYNSGGAVDAIKVVGSTLGANFGTQNLNAAGYSGLEYIDNAGVVAVFTGYKNGGTGEFRFNNIATNGFITFAIASSDKLTIANTGNVGIGTTPTTLLDLLGADNTTVQTIKINATQANVTAADTFLDFRSTTGSEGSIAGTAVAGVIAYNTFTGSHYTQVEDADRPSLQVGMLLEATGDAMTPLSKKTRIRTIPEKRHVGEKTGEETITPAQDIEETFEASHKPYLVKSRIARTKGSKAAYGVYGGTDKEGRDLVLALGTGLCYVTKTARAIAVGDYLMASDVAGMMEPQTDDIYRNSTVAKAMTVPVWAIGQTSQQIPCIYLGG